MSKEKKIRAIRIRQGDEVLMLNFDDWIWSLKGELSQLYARIAKLEAKINSGENR